MALLSVYGQYIDSPTTLQFARGQLSLSYSVIIAIFSPLLHAMNITPFDTSTRPSLHNSPGTHPYASSIASSASSSTSSVFSADGLSSQSSAPSSSKSLLNAGWEPDHGNADLITDYLPSSTADSCGSPNIASKTTETGNRTLEVAVAPELRQHPRRTQRPAQLETQVSGLANTAPRPPPSLVRQCERKDNFVESLVGKLTLTENYLVVCLLVIKIQQRR